jgi:HK97 family phage portal protein
MRGLFGSLRDGIGRKSGAVGTSLDLFREIYGGRASRSGRTVNVDTALQVATFFACIRVKAEDIAQAPCDLFQPREGGGKDIAANHPLYPLLTVQPNEYQTTFEFFETLVFHLESCFNFYAFKSIVRGRIDELIPIEPHRVKPRRLKDLTLVYDVSLDDGPSTTFPAAMIWHVRGPSWNGWQGLDFLKVAREALGLAMSIESDQAQLYKNGLRTSGTYSVEGTLDQTQYENLRAFIKEYQADEAGGPLILDRAAKYISETMTSVDAQTLEQRKHQVEEICRLVRVMPIMIGHSGDTSPTFASAEQFFGAHVKFSLLPPCRRIETSINKNLIGLPAALTGVRAKFNLDSLQRAAFKDRIDAIVKMLGAGGQEPMAEVNEVRELMDMNPVSWGDGKPARASAQRQPADNPDIPPKE